MEELKKMVSRIESIDQTVMAKIDQLNVMLGNMAVSLERNTQMLAAHKDIYQLQIRELTELLKKNSAALEETEDRVDKLEKTKDKFLYMIMGAIPFSGGVGEFVSRLFHL